MAERALTNELKALFTINEKKALNLFLKLGNPNDLLSFQAQEILRPFFESEARYAETLLKANQKAMMNGRKTTVDLLNIVSDKKYVLFDFDERIYTNMSNQTFTASQQTMTRIKTNIVKNLAKSYQEGLGIRDAGRNLQKEFKKLRTFEAERIARTEINSAQNAGAYQTYLDYDVEYHQWWTGQDARVRTSHRALQGMIVRVGSPFSNGLLRPGDKTGSIKEWIHCRCTTVPYLMPLGYMVPMGQSSFRESDIIPIPSFKIPRVAF